MDIKAILTNGEHKWYIVRSFGGWDLRDSEEHFVAHTDVSDVRAAAMHFVGEGNADTRVEFV